ncbi:ATPase AAA [Tepidanaerobacter syntrophicus]|uniref:Replication-associated recombination protein A n=1 Tax=Tepidanaerobacter syntrophicus TaxID=224999 RepID=A0A0U9HFL2_9FIRM|nr:replication-associated recombination protein A [Tepidanaerobacter syntrophicus]GAQ25485.1 ATPase [Tepidanaerobacter syntrophicus]GLI18560.1 ATPase AAA [Tepidanaerobacter syntrophicus]GLI50058.1 ATPase AAA [Tepidanaerobacter syntrophicus]HHV83167.1 replication-associated recombination protein A [Tepidanaerobacter syntrophicus]
MNDQASIFDTNKANSSSAPLADRMRPRTLDEFEGQEHILGKDKILRKLIENDSITSMILWGPPGTGKTTIARIIAEKTNAKFENFSAVLSGIKEIREVMKEAEERKHYGQRTLVFIDEIHRFNKSQQDAFLPFVEKGDIILIGATTENPSFELNSALLSRSKVFILKPLTVENIIAILKRALQDEKRGLGRMNIEISDEILEKLAIYSNGDARIALNTLELASLIALPDKEGKIVITEDILEEAFQKKTLLYDKKGEEHYNLISAFHKSVRNSDSDAAVYWLARMLEAGEDPLYIARRMIRIASEDIGLADPAAIQQAVAAFSAAHFLGMPECNTSLAQAAVYLALAPKSNAIYVAYLKAKEDAEKTLAEPVPLHIRNAPTNLMKEAGYGKGYKYAHDFEDKVAFMECLPENLRGKEYYHPSDAGEEKRFKELKGKLKSLQGKE